MADNYTAFSAPLVHAPRGLQTSFAYRTRLGMVPSAEFDVFHEDFNHLVSSSTPTGWSSILETTGTWANSTTFGNGVIVGTHATPSNGVAIYLPRIVQLAAGKKFFMEARVRTDDVTDNQVQIGLFDQTSVATADAPFTTTAANLISFGILDGAATTKMLCDKSNSGSTVETGTRSLVANTWHVLGIGYDGIGAVRGYVDGNLSQTWAQTFSTTVPLSTALSPFVAMDNGDGAGGASIFVDYIRFVIER